MRKEFLLSTMSFIVVSLPSMSCVMRHFHSSSSGTLENTQNSTRKLFSFESNVDQLTDIKKLEGTLEKATDIFMSKIRPVTGPIFVALGGNGCLRTGYQFDFKKVVFCNNTNTIELGTKSIDVIHHELFHALTCQIKPELCQRSFLTNPEKIAIHEALADLFAQQLIPDQYFGENFYKEKPYIRAYSTNFCLSLQEGEHARGHALLSSMLTAGATLETISTIFEKDLFTTEKITQLLNLQDTCLRSDGPQIALVPTSGQSSNLNRYRVQKNEAFKLKIIPNEAFSQRFSNPKIQLETRPNLFSFKQSQLDSGEITVEFTPIKDKGWEKITLQIYDKGLVGEKNIYLSLNSPQP